jgi:hypothetical protein
MKPVLRAARGYRLSGVITWLCISSPITSYALEWVAESKGNSVTLFQVHNPGYHSLLSRYMAAEGYCGSLCRHQEEASLHIQGCHSAVQHRLGQQCPGPSGPSRTIGRCSQGRSVPACPPAGGGGGVIR